MNYTQVSLWPYEETEIRFEADQIKVRTPWISGQLEMQIEPSLRIEIQRILLEGPESLAEIHLINRLSQPFASMPAFYLLPRPGLNKDQDLEFRPTPNKENTSRWDVDPIFEATRTADGFDPMSVWSHLRRLHLKNVVEYKEDINLSKNLSALQGDALRAALIASLRQNHYVTVRCQEVLTPALELHAPSIENVEEFLAEERGHDLLLARSLQLLGVSPEQVPVMPAMVELMDHFKAIAGSNFIAFAFMVDIFERTPSSNKNPIVTGLQRLGEAKAAEPLVKHLDINIEGEHDSEGLELLGALKACDENYVRQAAVLAEQASDLILKVSADRVRNLK